MTALTDDDLKAGKALHAELNWALEARRAGGDWRDTYREKKDEVRSFWLRHGEEVLAALEEARERIAELESERAAMKDSAKPMPVEEG